MTKERIMEIIMEENLKYYNWYDDHKIKPNEVGIIKEGSEWSVYTTDERANPVSKKTFQFEEKALENFIKRLRALNKFNSLHHGPSHY